MEEAVHKPRVCSSQGSPQRDEGAGSEIASELHAESHDLGVEHIIRPGKSVVFDDAGVIQGDRGGPAAGGRSPEWLKVESTAGAGDWIDGSELGETLALAGTRQK
jgi:hypothetical protein